MAVFRRIEKLGTRVIGVWTTGRFSADGFLALDYILGVKFPVTSNHCPACHLAADLLESVGHVLSLVSIVRQSNEMHAFDVAEASNLPNLNEEGLPRIRPRARPVSKKTLGRGLSLKLAFGCLLALAEQ